ncbi:MAG: serine/threonine-protein kinase [Myxococcota bacterium]
MKAQGSTIGDWSLRTPVGRGGVAEVWRAEHPDGRIAAVKILLRPTEEAKRRFRREARVLDALDHENLLRVVEWVDQDGVVGLITEFMEGPPLRDWARTRPYDEIIAVFERILDGVAAAHEAGLIHRDLKPSNILLNGETPPVPRVADFGLAKRNEDPQLTATGVVLGTPAYMAPEQVSDARSVDARADVFSLAATLYELLCGRAPFIGDSALDVLNKARTGHYPDPRTLMPRLPTPVVAAIRGGLQPDPNQRIPDVATFRDVLTNVVPWSPTLPTTASWTWQPVVQGMLVGRDEEQDDLRQALDEYALVSLCGPIGVGKSALARWALTDRGAGLHIDVADCTRASDVVRRVAQAMAPPMPWPDLETMSKAVAGCLSGQPRLVVLDGLAVDEGLQVHLARWTQRGAIVLITGPAPIGFPGEVTLQVSPLTPVAAVDLLRKLVEPHSLTMEEATRVVATVGALPRVLEVVASWLVETGLEAALESWHDSKTGDALNQVVERAWARLSSIEADVCTQLSIFEGGFRMDAAAAVVEVPRGVNLRVVIAQLRQRSLLQATPHPAQPGRSRLRLYPHVRRAAGTARVDEPALQRRFVAWAAQLGAAWPTWSLRGGDARVLALQPEQANLEAAWALAETPEHRSHVAIALCEIYDALGPVYKSAEVARSVLEGCHDPKLWRRLAGHVVFGMVLAGDLEGALAAAESLTQTPQAGQVGPIVQLLKTTPLSRMGRLTETTELLNRVLPHLPEGLTRNLLLRNRAHMRMALGEIEEAAADLDASAAFFTHQSSLREHSFFLLYRCELSLHRPPIDHAAFEMARRGFKRVGLTRGLVVALRMYGGAMVMVGHPKRARPCLMEMVDLAIRLGTPSRQVMGLALLAWCDLIEGDYEAATERVETGESVALEHEVTDGVSLGYLVATQARIALTCNDPVTALQVLEAAGPLVHTPEGLALTAQAHAGLGSVEEANALMARATEGMPPTAHGLLFTGTEIAATYALLGQEAPCRALCRRVRAAWQEAGWTERAYAYQLLQRIDPEA